MRLSTRRHSLQAETSTPKTAPFARRRVSMAATGSRSRFRPWAAAAGSEEALQWGEDANRYAPELRTFDRFGRRLDEVKFHPAYHHLMALAMEHRIHSIGWREKREGKHVAHAAMLALFSQAEAGTMCPISMTYASVPALRHQADVAAAWLAKIVDGVYDAPLRPYRRKARRYRRHGDDRKAGRFRCSRKHHARLRAEQGRAGGGVPSRGPQMVLLRAHERRLSDDGLHRSRA